MKQLKNNRRVTRMHGLQLMLLLFLCIGCLAVATGTAYARYRSEGEDDLLFEVRQPDQLVMGTIQEEKFVPLAPADQLQWTIDETNGIASLTFTIANGSDKKNFSEKEQTVKLRMLGTLNLAVTGTPPELTVTYGSEKLNGETVEKTAVGEVSYLVKGTALHHSYGDSLLYTFYETTAEGKDEVTWELPGGELSYVTLTIKMTGDISEKSGLLQPVIVAEPMEP